jgi:hypothetical protein
VLFCVMCVICVLCLIVVPLPPGENPFAVKYKYNIYIYYEDEKCNEGTANMFTEKDLMPELRHLSIGLYSCRAYQ